MDSCRNRGGKCSYTISGIGINMVAKPRMVEIDFKNKTVTVKTINRVNYDNSMDETINVDVKAGPMKDVPALFLTVIADDGYAYTFSDDNLDAITGRDKEPGEEEEKPKGTAMAGHGWPGEDEGRDYGGLISNPPDDNVKKRKNVKYY